MSLISLKQDKVPLVFGIAISIGVFFVARLTPYLDGSNPYLGQFEYFQPNNKSGQNYYVTVQNLTAGTKFSDLKLYITASIDECSFTRKATKLYESSESTQYWKNLNNQPINDEKIREVQVPNVNLQPSEYLKFAFLYSCNDASKIVFSQPTVTIESEKAILIVKSSFIAHMLQFRFYYSLALALISFFIGFVILKKAMQGIQVGDD